MQDLLTRLFESQDQIMNNFNMGFAAGVLFALVVIFVLLILRIFTIVIFRTKRAHCIAIRRPEGDTEVSKNAIISVIRSFSNEFKYIDVRKIDLYRRGARYFVKLIIHFDTSGGGSPTQEERLRNAIRESLEKTFGITSICRISMKIDRADGVIVQATPEQLEAPAPEAEKGPVVEEKKDDKPGDPKAAEEAEIKDPDPLP